MEMNMKKIKNLLLVILFTLLLGGCNATGETPDISASGSTEVQDLEATASLIPELPVISSPSPTIKPDAIPSPTPKAAGGTPIQSPIAPEPAVAQQPEKTPPESTPESEIIKPIATPEPEIVQPIVAPEPEIIQSAAAPVQTISESVAPETPIVETPTQTAIETTYILNSETHKFHRLNCSYLPTTNRVDSTSSKDELISNGYEACKKCNP
jgi:hypothetical protein